MTTTRPPHHDASHDLALLERFVRDSVEQLPALPAALPHQLPPRSAAYHTACAAMLRDVLRVVTPLSPRLAQLIAQIWDLTSLNVFVLLQLATTALHDKDAAVALAQQRARFGDTTTAQHAARVLAYEAELEQMRRDARELRAELQTTRQRANRLAVENAQLRKAVHGLVELNDALSDRRDATIEKLDDTPLGTTSGSAEEWELYGVSTDDLEKLDVVHPIESCAQDFDQLFQGLVDRAREQLAVVNEMDRFMNSSVVSLLWRHGPDEDQTRFLQQMMSKRTVTTQTDELELGGLPDDDDDDDGSDADAEDDETHASGATGAATAVTKRQVLPPSLRAQLTTRPKITRVLEAAPLSRIVLMLLMEKMERDAVALRTAPFATPRAPLHRVMKDFFLSRYNLVSLAEYRLMEVVKSVLYYHEKLESDARRRRMYPPAEEVRHETDDDEAETDDPTAFALLPDLDVRLLHPDDVRIAVFARLAELVPLAWPPSLVPPAGGNLAACATNAVVDFLGDVIELDRTSATVRDLVERLPSHAWTFPLEAAHSLVMHHFAYCDASQHARLERHLRRLATSTSTIPVDALVAFFATQWFAADQRLTASLHDAFHRAAEVATSAVPMATLQRLWRTLPHEHVSLAELDELERAFATILDVRQAPPRRVSTKRASVASMSMGRCVGGISENEFVFQSQQILRARRVCRGLRTHGRAVTIAGAVLGPRGLPVESETVAIAVDELKPWA